MLQIIVNILQVILNILQVTLNELLVIFNKELVIFNELLVILNSSDDNFISWPASFRCNRFGERFRFQHFSDKNLNFKGEGVDLQI